MKFMSIIFKAFVFSLILIGHVEIGYAQTASILPPAKTTFSDQNGKPLVSGTVDFYIPGTTTRKTTWKDAGQTVPNTNPVLLDSSGRATILGDGSYRQVLKDRYGNVVWDGYTSSAGSGGGGGGTPTVGDGDAVGTIKPWGGFIAPYGYVFAYGQELTRAGYPEAFAALTSQQNANCTSGSPTLTGISDTQSIPIGASIESSCLNSGATVVSKTISSVVASSNSIITTTTTSRFFPYGDGDGVNTFNMPDLSGRVIAGRDNMGGISKNRLSPPYFSSAAAIGASGGTQSQTINSINLPPYTPSGSVTTTTTLTTPASAVLWNSGAGTLGSIAAGSTYSVGPAVTASSSSTFTGTAQGGTQTPYSIVQPTITANYIIKVIPDSNPNSFFGVASIGGMYGILTCGSGISCSGNTISTIVTPPVGPNTVVYATDYGVLCDGATDDYAAAQAAITAAAGREVIFPTGTCKISQTLNYTTSSSNVFTQGLQITGQGREKTIFDTSASNNFLISLDTSASNKFQTGVNLQGFKIISSANTIGAGGIRLHRAAYAKIEDVQITGLNGNGLYVPIAGDPDSSFEIVIDRVRMDNIAGWCMDFLPDSGTELSNVRITNSSFQSCGTLSASNPPTSGAIRWRGILMQILNSGFTTNNNVAVYMADGGTAQGLTIDGTAFENTTSTLFPSIYSIGGMRQFSMNNSQCLNNDSYVSRGCAWFDSTNGPVGNVKITNQQIRATTGNNPYTAFKLTGANTMSTFIRADNIYWQTFGGAGQIRFSGFQFDPMQGQARFSVTGLGTAQVIPVGYGAVIPLKLGDVGEWVPYQVPNSGITLSGLTGLLPNTLYYFYLTNSAATPNQPITGSLEISQMGPVLDSVSGYAVRSNDSARTYVGQATTNGSGAITTNGTDLSWYAPLSTVAVNSITNAQLAQSAALTIKGNPSNTTANVQDISATASSSCVFRENSASLACGSINLASSGAVGNSILGSANGGTSNAFTAFSGPISTAKTFTLPNASSTILTTNAAVTVAQGGTGGTSASGTLLDNITNFSGTGFLTRTGSGTYAFQSTTNGVTNSNLVQSGAATLKGNPTAGTANVTDFTIQGLMARGAPDATNDKIPLYDNAAGTIKYVTPAQIASSATAGVSSIAGNTGAFTIGGLLTNSTNLLQVTAGTKVQQQTGTSNVVAVTPAHQQDHDSAAKVWISFSGQSAAGAVPIDASYNVTSAIKTATAGVYTIAFTTPFASANYACSVTSENTSVIAPLGGILSSTAKTASQVTIFFENAGATTGQEPVHGHLVCFGRQ